MKKIYTSMFMLICAITAAQDVTLYEQVVTGTTGIVSSIRTVDPVEGVWCSDDFTLTDGGNINKITVYGFSSLATTMDPALEGVDVYIFADNNGAPAGHPTSPDSWLFFQNFPTTSAGYSVVSDGNNRTFVLDLAAVETSFSASPGVKYWLSVTPRIALDFIATSGLRWNWFQGTAPEGTSNAHISSSGGLFGLPEATWQNFTSIGLSGHLSMKLEEITTMSSESFLANEVKVFPNPAKDVISIQVAPSIIIENVTLFNSLGRQINVQNTNNTINVSFLSSGIYFLNIETNEGQLTRKIVKE